MIGITFTGVIVHYSGLHIGTMHDAPILRENPPQFEPWEWGIGDGAFIGNPNILVAFQNQEGKQLNDDQLHFNGWFNYWRGRVEHIIGEVKNHDMLSGVFRGSFVLLHAATRLTVHLTNVKIKLNPPRYETVGPWRHEPGSAP